MSVELSCWNASSGLEHLTVQPPLWVLQSSHAVETGHVQGGGCSTMHMGSLMGRHGVEPLPTSKHDIGEQESNLNCHKT